MAGVRLLVSFKAEGAITEGFLAEWASRCKATLSEPGAIQFDLCRSVVDPERFVLVEHWESQELLSEHWQRTFGGRPPTAEATLPRLAPAGFELYQQKSSAFDGRTVRPLED